MHPLSPTANVKIHSFCFFFNTNNMYHKNMKGKAINVFAGITYLYDTKEKSFTVTNCT